MTTTAQRVVSKFNEIIAPDDPPKDLREVAANACSACGMPPEEARHYAHENEAKIRDAALALIKRSLCEPIFYFLVTSGVFTAGSEKLMQQAGVIGIDGKRLATLLADHGVGLDANRTFDAVIFKSMIRDQEKKVKDPGFA